MDSGLTEQFEIYSLTPQQNISHTPTSIIPAETPAVQSVQLLP